MKTDEIYEFEHDGLGVVFRRKDLSVLLIPGRDANFEDGAKIRSIGSTTDIQQFMCKDIMQPDSHGNCEFIHTPTNILSDPRPTLDRLTLAISNVCNLGCSYCYASGGTYYNVDGLMMTRETALNALNQAAQVYSRIEHINFFGGEPTLNRDIIEVVCEYARYLYARGILTHLPSFGITTNGYAIDNRMLEVLTGYKFGVTLSLDGPKEIHDLKRPTKAGKGSYESVATNAKRLLDNGLHVDFECTYTADHLRLG